ncbi:MAG: DUF4405 domain-containing protein [Selenomonadaceae bacterium]|nr:DUF4405 domain-containing protein [Selenomonadaceae bacterium]
MNNIDKKLILDILLFILCLICVVTGVVLDFQILPKGTGERHIYRKIHTYSGYIMIVAIAIHIYWNRVWIGILQKKLLINKIGNQHEG